MNARSSGGVDRFNLDLYARVSAQWAGRNLDSSDKVGLGGVNAVRAYPNGEGCGDTGWVAPTEVCYA